MGFPGGSAVKESACRVGELGSIPGLGISGEGKGYPLQYSGLKNSKDCRVHGVTKSRTRLSNFSLLLTETRKMVAFYIDGKRWTIIVSFQQSNHIPIAKFKCCELIFKFEEK